MKLPLPKYFQDLYNQYSSLNRFPLKDVIYDKRTQERFMRAVKEEIEEKQSLSPLKKREIWKVIQESKFPILLGIFVTIEGMVETCFG
mmetsp:Transcript_10025/g.16856  ORF Transcript_10025/g.16856 Transcript_10025/m.16856 type:complete len:88 (+) Transcript_10025:1002-1265(+)